MSAPECQDHLFCLLKTLPSDRYLSLLWITHSTLPRWLLNWRGQGWGFGAIIPFSGHQTTVRSQRSNLELKKVLRVLKRRNLGFQNRNVCRYFYFGGGGDMLKYGKNRIGGPSALILLTQRTRRVPSCSPGCPLCLVQCLALTDAQ